MGFDGCSWAKDLSARPSLLAARCLHDVHSTYEQLYTNDAHVKYVYDGKSGHMPFRFECAPYQNVLEQAANVAPVEYRIIMQVRKSPQSTTRFILDSCYNFIRQIKTCTYIDMQYVHRYVLRIILLIMYPGLLYCFRAVLGM